MRVYEISVTIPATKTQNPFEAMDALIEPLSVSCDYGYDLMAGEREAFISSAVRGDAEQLERRIREALSKNGVGGATVKLWEFDR